MLPDFNDFLVTLDPDKIGKKIQDLHIERLYQIQSSETLSDPVIGLIQELYRNSVADACQIVTRVYLAEYHKWLQEYLE